MNATPKPIGRYEVNLTSDGGAELIRETAESDVRVTLWRGQGGGATTTFDVAPSIDVSAFPQLLDSFCRAADLHLNVAFRATKLSSSHVVLEDTGLGMGAALFALLTDRMQAEGVNGAGSSLRTAEEFHTAGVSASISVEGRKFLKILSPDGIDGFRWRNVMGHTAFGGVRSEDIDDFIDAIAGGLRGSLFLHERRVYDDADAFWRDAITAFGRALSEVFGPNPARKGLPPGVKATLF